MVMPYQGLVDAVRGQAPIIRGPNIRDDQFQPATIDLRLGDKIYAVPAGFLPGSHESMLGRIMEVKNYDFSLVPNRTYHLDQGLLYMAPLMESCNFPETVRMHFSPKSSVGRNDVFVWVISEKHRRYDRTPWGYRGGLWLQIKPQSFNVGVRVGLPLVQGRIKTRSSRTLDVDQLQQLHQKHALVVGKDGVPISGRDLHMEDGKLELHVDLERDIVGFRAKRQVATRLDLGVSVDTYDPKEFWEPLYRPANGRLVLDPDEFYLLATVERIKIPPECCGELLQVDPGLGEFRVHYAGFFDNGFGGKDGTHGVLEVRASSVAFELQHNQTVCVMVFERTSEIPTKLYGVGSNYTEPKPSLSKHFSHRYGAWDMGFWTK